MNITILLLHQMLFSYYIQRTPLSFLLRISLHLPLGLPEIHTNRFYFLREPSEYQVEHFQSLMIPIVFDLIESFHSSDIIHKLKRLAHQSRTAYSLNGTFPVLQCPKFEILQLCLFGIFFFLLYKVPPKVGAKFS